MVINIGLFATSRCDPLSPLCLRKHWSLGRTNPGKEEARYDFATTGRRSGQSELARRETAFLARLAVRRAVHGGVRAGLPRPDRLLDLSQPVPHAADRR